MPAASFSRLLRAAAIACSGDRPAFLARDTRFFMSSMSSGLAPYIRSLICAAASSASKIEKPRLSPTAACSICRNFRPSAWKVQMVTSSASCSRRRLATRSRISLADLLVKVIAAMRLAG
ncbi:hypothetical protein D3C72_1816290 [compost metagenome]